MPVATFDTLKFANTLKAAGVPDKQAEAQAVAFAEVIQINLKDLVTKDDLQQAVKELRREIVDARDEARREIVDARDEARQELKEESLKLHAKMDTLYAKLVGEMSLLKWMFGLNITVLVGLVVRSFFYHAS